MEKFSPTLLIGLGGIGSSIVERIYRQFDAGHPTEKERANAAFLCLDTDENDINERRKVLPPDNVVKTSSDLSCTIGQYIDKIRHKTTVEKWFDTKSFELNSMSLNDGAAQVRMASRLAMISAINEGKLAAIDNSIDKLLATDPERKKGNNIRIHIISSLAGGTGAGTFLQMAYYVQSAMREKGALAPKINGFFVLPDTIIKGTGTFNDAQCQNVRSNAYACMKELITFSGLDKSKGLKPIEFEYKLGQRDKSLPVDRPYDMCFLMDYDGAAGGNLQKLDRYKGQMATYVFHMVFGRTGGNFRSNALNDIRQRIKADATNIYCSFGISRLVYPVDDLFAYFANQSVADNFSTVWCRADRDIQARMDEYNRNVFNGIPDTQPKKGEEFMRNIQNYKDGAGPVATQFKHIFNSTQILSEDLMPMGSKASQYIQEVQQFVQDTVERNTTLSELYAESTIDDPNFTKRDDSTGDINFVARRERTLEDFRKEAMAFVDSSKAYTLRECLAVDHETDDYVSKTPESNRHHLNTYILEKDNEMHPLAARYFLYDVQAELEAILEGKDGLIKTNRALKKTIEEEYKDFFDDLETKGTKESAIDSIKGSRKKMKGLSKVTSLISGQNPYKAAKENYEVRSKQQAEDIRAYAVNKLMEDTLSGLLGQVNRLLEESESFFENLPAAIDTIENERITLLKKHSVENADPSVEYVLASEEQKKIVYEQVVSRNQSPFFPTRMSASIYRTMFHTMIETLSNESSAILSKKKDKKAKKAATVESNERIIRECLVYQDGILREQHQLFSEMNVMDALKMEAKLETGENDPDSVEVKEYMLRKFHNFRDRAEIWGPSGLDTEVRYINAWGYHPACVDISTVSASLADELFGDTAVDTNPANAASRLESPFFSPYEIVRCNTATLLYIEKHFPQFVSRAKTGLSDERIGEYYRAYDDVIKSLHKADSTVISPHLDKHWHLPACMSEIGVPLEEEKKKLFRALYGGILFDKFKAANDGGENYWKFKDRTTRFIRDIDGRRVSIGQSQAVALNNLFAQGLANNPDIVDLVNDYVQEQWQEAREKWLATECDEATELQKMKDSKIVKLITEFKFNIHSSFAKEQNWFTLLSSRKGLDLFNVIGELKDFFFEDLAAHLIEVFGASANTGKLCKWVFGKVGAALKDDASGILEHLESEGRFEPKDA